MDELEAELARLRAQIFELTQSLGKLKLMFEEKASQLCEAVLDFKKLNARVEAREREQAGVQGQEQAK